MGRGADAFARDALAAGRALAWVQDGLEQSVFTWRTHEPAGFHSRRRVSQHPVPDAVGSRSSSAPGPRNPPKLRPKARQDCRFVARRGTLVHPRTRACSRSSIVPPDRFMLMFPQPRTRRPTRVRVFSITQAFSMQAMMIRTAPPQIGQVSMSLATTRSNAVTHRPLVTGRSKFSVVQAPAGFLRSNGGTAGLACLWQMNQSLSG
jgi:hypothetical protein